MLRIINKANLKRLNSFRFAKLRSTFKLQPKLFLLFMSVFSKSLLTLMGIHLMSFPFLSARHNLYFFSKELLYVCFNLIYKSLSRFERRNEMFRNIAMSNLLKLSAIFACLVTAPAVWAANITAIEFSSLTGDRTEVRLTFDEQPAEPRSYAIESPARISVDFPETQSQVDKYHAIGAGNARSATIVTAGDRTRLVMNLTNLVPYSMVRSGNQLIMLVGEE